jgi:hypothetical protein
VGLQIDPNAEMMRRKDFNTVEEDCLRVLKNNLKKKKFYLENISLLLIIFIRP